MEIDHYVILGLPSGEEGAKLTDEKIGKAYRTKALELHPDKNRNDPNANTKFLKLKESYLILKDEKARKAFDDLLRVKRDQQQRQSQYDSKKRKMMADLDERERASFAPDRTRQERDNEERIARVFKEECDRIRAMHAKKAGAGTGTPKANAEFGTSGTNGESAGNGASLDPSKALKVTWEGGVEDYSAQRLRELFGEFGDVEDIVIRSQKKKKKIGSALVVMASADAAVAALKGVCGDLSNPLLVLPLQKTGQSEFSNVSPFKKFEEPVEPIMINLVGAGHQAKEDSILEKLRKKAAEKKNENSGNGAI
ncbi:hypothetical protein MKW98_010844 [Papaver atlanticum]|uniref:J domain-containing protein n=1 Tax=Papaver atlanticum TaxID=357466 RepID=A0AAD4XG65_9MAGN|nr:hypothetical protein MKW98_010844 [Papaver atlanticum]